MYKKELTIPGVVGTLEAVWQQQQLDASFPAIGIICHPHPLFGGNMHNKVVTTTAKALNNMGLATITFNFRGVGKSIGEFGNAIGETEDCLAVVTWVAANWSGVDLWLAGFSFGSYIAANVASKLNYVAHKTNAMLDSVIPSSMALDNSTVDSAAYIHSVNIRVVQLLSIAPPVHHNDFHHLNITCPWLVIQGDDDEIVPADQVYAWYNELQAEKTLIKLPQAGHFFHGKLINLAQVIHSHYIGDHHGLS